MDLDPKVALGFYLVFVISVTVHEAAHAWSAHKLGDDTAYEVGQVSLNPIPHMARAPFGMLLLPLLSLALVGFPLGFAHAPYDPIWAARYPKRAAWMALAGPVSNILLASLAFVLLRVGLASGYFLEGRELFFLVAMSPEPGLASSLAMFGSFMLFMNVLLAFFNLIPVPPLDGSGVLPLVLPRSALLRVQRLFAEPWAPMMGLMISWLIINKKFHVVFLPIREALVAGL